MSKNQPLSFVHRRNRDGSYDSICPRCAATAASSGTEAGLCEGEHNHICDKYLLEARLKHITHPDAGSKPPEAAS